VTIVPLVLAAEPRISQEGGEGIYKDASGVRPDQEKEIRALGGFSVQGFVIKKDAGYVLRAENFSVAIGGQVSPGVEAILKIFSCPRTRSTGWSGRSSTSSSASS